MKFSIEDHLSRDDDEKLFNWSDQVFPVEANPYTWADSQKHIIARDNDFPAAHLGYGFYTIVTEGQKVTTIGVGDIVVRPEYQGQHIPTTLFEMLHGQEELQTKNILFSLFCPQRLVPYYNHFGYSLYPDSVEFLQDDKYVKCISPQFMTRGPNIFGHIRIPSEPW
ncbi:MAG: GNAT family N-acetyltransferase [Cellvibrionaceae bacterium]